MFVQKLSVDAWSFLLRNLADISCFLEEFSPHLGVFGMGLQACLCAELSAAEAVVGDRLIWLCP
ncbi:hypothetical protein [Ottowia thiooxydans]|uniref:hypothetical protein n=1 Tax=Ottowia thiooxydans TaxID=219182 RepID=UPI00041DC507|nr:hypothetical protein [Ottowia thiooxydans]